MARPSSDVKVSKRSGMSGPIMSAAKEHNMNNPKTTIRRGKGK